MDPSFDPLLKYTKFFENTQQSKATAGVAGPADKLFGCRAAVGRADSNRRVAHGSDDKAATVPTWPGTRDCSSRVYKGCCQLKEEVRPCILQ